MRPEPAPTSAQGGSQLARRRLERLALALRQRLRSSELWLIAFAILVGAAAGGATTLQGRLAHALQTAFYGVAAGERLSSSGPHWEVLFWLPAGGLILGVLAEVLRRRRSQPLVDVVEANALHGGRLGLAESAIVCLQTVLSNGFGASVGLEAAYAQAGGVIASAAGAQLRLRRADLRVLVGAGAGAAIGAAFGAPLTGAFYAFEIVIGAYTPAALAPVAAACLAGVLSAKAMGGLPYSITVQAQPAPDALAYLLYAALGLLCALFGVAMMQAVALIERWMRRAPLPAMTRPAIGGVLLAALALGSPQTLSSGHGALHADLVDVTVMALASILVLKAAASIISLAFGFRGGLFFASLFLGSLMGQLYARGLLALNLPAEITATNGALVGMGALAAAIVGGPMTMSFLVLETTRDFGVAVATLAAALLASTVVRERFGYSFSTWRLHLRGETIRSARDIGWARSLTAGRMMRQDTATIAEGATIEEFRRRFPLGSATRVILLDKSDRYAGLVVAAQAFEDSAKREAAVSDLRQSHDVSLRPDMNIEQVMRVFDAHGVEELAVVDDAGQLLGVLAENYVTRRYARELEKRQREVFGEA